jgi:hypothetical protein
MKQLLLASRRWVPLGLALSLGSLWVWVGLLEVLAIDTRGAWGRVTGLTWAIYLLGVPTFAGLSVLSAMTSMIIRRSTAARDVTLVVAATLAVAFWR